MCANSLWAKSVKPTFTTSSRRLDSCLSSFPFRISDESTQLEFIRFEELVSPCNVSYYSVIIYCTFNSKRAFGKNTYSIVYLGTTGLVTVCREVFNANLANLDSLFTNCCSCLCKHRCSYSAQSTQLRCAFGNVELVQVEIYFQNDLARQLVLLE